MRFVDQNERYIQMTTSPVEGLICKMAVPAIVSMIISSLYNMADTFFVGRISTDATAAVGVIFPYMAVVQAAGFFFGQGSANFISRRLGARDRDSAERMASTGFFSALLFAVILMIAGFVFMDPILKLLGAIPEIRDQARSYFFCILFGTPFIMTTFVLNNQMRMQGNAAMSMIGISIGAVLNIGLDPLFIFVFDMGVSGAAAATAISQFVSFAVMLRMSFLRGGVGVRLSKFTPKFSYYKEIASVGFPSLCRQGLASIAGICLNQLAGAYGDSAIAAFSVVNRVIMFANSALLGFGQGFQPVSGFNYGAGLFDRVKKGFFFCVKVAAVFCTAIGVVAFVFAPDIICLFRKEDPVLVGIATDILRLECFTFPLLGFTVISNMFLQNTKRTGLASLIAIARQGMFFLPIAFAAEAVLGLTGLKGAQFVANILTFMLSVPCAVYALRKMMSMSAPEPDAGEIHDIE